MAVIGSQEGNRMVDYRYTDNEVDEDDPMRSYYVEYYELLKSKNLLYSQSGKDLSVWGYCYFDFKTQKPEIRCELGKKILERAAGMGINVGDPNDFSGENVKNAFRQMIEKDPGYTPHCFYYLPFENQDLLNWVTDRNTMVLQGKIATKDLYKQACHATRTAMWCYMTMAPDGIWWNVNESLEAATVRTSCYFDTFYYANKCTDIKHVYLTCMWRAIVDGDGPVGDRVLGSYLTDPTMLEFINNTPEFSYDKLATCAMRNRDEYEKQHGRLDDDVRVRDEFAKGFIGLGRTF